MTEASPLVVPAELTRILRAATSQAQALSGLEQDR